MTTIHYLKTMLIVSVGLSLPLMVGCPAKRGALLTGQEEIRSARALTRAGKSQAAFERFSEIVAQNPDSLDAHRGLIEAAYYAGRLDETSQRYQKMIGSDRSGLGHYGLALVASAKGGDRMQTALDEFAKAAQALPQQSDIPYRMAKVYMQDGRWQEAVTYLLKVIEREPGQLGARVAYGKCLYELGQGDKAIEVLRPVVGQNLSPANAINARAIASAVFDPQRSLPIELSSEITKATDFLARDAAQPALTVLKGLVARYPEAAFIYTLTGLAHSQIGSNGEAVAAFERALELNSKMPLAQVGLGDVYMRLEKFAQARSYFEQAVGLNPFYIDAYRRLGEMALKLGDLDRAVRNFELVVLLQPEEPSNLHVFAQVLVQSGRILESIAVYKQILEGDEDDLKAVMRLIKLYVLMGQREPTMRERYRDQAREYLEQAEELAPESEAVKQIMAELEDD